MPPPRKVKLIPNTIRAHDEHISAYWSVPALSIQSPLGYEILLRFRWYRS
jgi:hypothetical protein